MILVLPVILISLVGVSGYPQFQTLIPNGNKVPNPCNTEELWPGVGHKLIGGSGERNPFGNDFDNNNKIWNRTLCEMDSDGDGIKNGVELGDPDCTWTPNSTPTITTQLSHPGVCEPVNSTKCKENNSWLTCPKAFSCPDFEKNTTQSMDLFLPTTAVPAQETTYICHAFKMPNDTKYHEIGLIPHLVNKEIMHHMLVYGCRAPPDEKYFTEAGPCTMGIAGCQTIIGMWSVGIEGECHPGQYGFPIGMSGFEYVIVQLHWNNPQLTTGMTDSSGVTIYYTDQLRPNDAMVIMTGQQYLEIPPKQESVTFEGRCKTICSNLIQPQTVNIPAAVLHMHLLGKSGSVELYRDGVLSKVLVKQDHYDYNTPIVHTFDEPIEFKAGDEIKVVCEFQSLKNNNTVYWGEGTQDEMCYGFVTLYPAVPGFERCVEILDLADCSMPQFDFYEANDCSAETFYPLIEPIGLLCTYGNYSEVCKALIKGLYSTGCMGSSMWQVIKPVLIYTVPNGEGPALIILIEDCLRVVLEEESATVTVNPGGETCQPQTNRASALVSNRACHNIFLFIPVCMYLLSTWLLKLT